MYSSKIEGETIELDSYIKHKRFGIPFKPDYTRKIDDLYTAYQYAKTHVPNTETIALAPMERWEWTQCETVGKMVSRSSFGPESLVYSIRKVVLHQAC